MKGNFDAVDADGLAEGKGLEGDVLTETEFQDVFVALGGEVVFVVGSGVISVGVGDEGFVDGFVGIYVDIGGGAVEAGLSLDEHMSGFGFRVSGDGFRVTGDEGLETRGWFL